MSTGRIYHHTPVMEGYEPKGWGVLELASKERDRAIAGVFQLSNPQEREYTLRVRGLNRAKKYKVTWDNSSQTTVIDGYVLMNQGLIIRLEGALTSELLLFEAGNSKKVCTTISSIPITGLRSSRDCSFFLFAGIVAQYT
ncbi:GH36 C-terminal domain-containing protein [Paenibacillus mendelii]|uniref:GH36 C-terminal domain-containing protein n=1 Tax=Paenibacillus mendelii TaxID=206163 RepID=A0ABV6J3I4_9BACL|nr:GH36 C-terminal domain-containing protein [Paenibacillus mendelii]MCQ6559415.1 GH36 C-terminal domain-containing protein [Paenibacillus mendelii]